MTGWRRILARLLLFGGLAAGEQTTSSVGRAYLERATSKDVVALSDLWYLDMTSLTVDCVRGVSKCPILSWILVDVPGRCCRERGCGKMRGGAWEW